MMLYKLIPPSVVTATIQLPASKSISNRALIINALGKGIYPPDVYKRQDDTLWSNEPFFQEIEKQYTDLLKPYGTSEDISAALFQTEMNNLKYLGYGAKAFTISMVETALHVSGQKISGTDIQHIIELGKSLLKMPIELFPGVKETLKVLKEKGKYLSLIHI